MSKRKTVDLKLEEEDYLKSVIAGAVPKRILENIPSTEKKAGDVQTSLQEEKPGKGIKDAEKEIQPRASKRKNKDASEYQDLFLVKRENAKKRQTYISNEIYCKIKRYLPVITKEISITAYLDNIIRHHLEEYMEAINQLYDDNFKKPF